MFCGNCGEKINTDGKFCTSCGCVLPQRVPSHHSYVQPVLVDERKVVPPEPLHVKEQLLQATGKLNALVGEQGELKVSLREVFSAVLAKHSKEEGELLFIAGTGITTPQEHEISSSWPKPWLFSRVFITFFLTYALLYICTFMFENPLSIPGLITIGSFAVPFSLLIFFWEMNAPRNISIYEIAKMFFVGGAASLVLTLVLYSFLPVDDVDFSGAMIIGIVEETGKLGIIAYFIKKLNPKFILNGLLIGATIGAGFAAFESAGYAWYAYSASGFILGDEMMLDVIVLRAWMAIGTHVAWSAIAGAALVYVKGQHSLMKDHLFDFRFVRLLGVAIILHAVWDMPLYSFDQFYFRFIVLILLAWVFIFTLLNAGLQQIARLHQEVEGA
ncbi:PrsW family glutamic-type intramembrane protease [Planococcus lenghuensis]|uniref:PrsW family intramembrane metalloprotease n=1 Tax=Planococcus lenghuensis TaxID=2213202 RepID=A0A1Q2L3Y5_9BACL|nr:PrsW family intramembrane metalloprotease [Planococcus lenghuensis]AQQ55136.1 hypothetical protein B0X71_14335 [Planococcus lenghuensis]